MAKRLISKEELVERYPPSDITPLIEANLAKLLDSLNKFRLIYGKPMICNSGLRTVDHNAAVGGAPNSSHLTGEAADFRDPTGELDKYCMEHQDILEQCGLYLEHPDATPGWCHLQVRRPASGNRVFRP